MHPFMVKHLKLDPLGLFDDNNKLYAEAATTIESTEQMYVFDESRPYLANALRLGSQPDPFVSLTAEFR